MSHNEASQETRTDQGGMSTSGQDENTTEIWARLRVSNNGKRDVLWVMEQLYRSGTCTQPVDLYEGSTYPSNRSREETGGNGHQRNAAVRVAMPDWSAQCASDDTGTTGVETSRSALSVVAAVNLYPDASGAQTRVTQESEPASIPSAAESDALVRLPSQVLHKKNVDDRFLEPMFYSDGRGRFRPFTAELDTGSKITLARLSIAKRANAIIFKLDRPEMLATAFLGREIGCKQFACLELRRQRRPDRARWITVYLLDDQDLPFADAYLGRGDAREFGLEISFPEDRVDRSRSIPSQRL